MTISTTIIKNSYSGDGSEDTFAYQFKISADADLQVIIRSSTGVETVKTLTTHYTVTGAGVATGGNVVFTSGNIPAATETVVIRRATTQTQTLDLVENDPFTADSVEGAFDKNLAAIQELQEQVDRSFKISRTNSITSSEFTTSATDRASKALGFDSSGDLTTIADYLPQGGDSVLMTYSTTTTDSDPGAGKIRLNNTTIASATAAYVDDAEYNATDISTWVQTWDDNSTNYTNRGRMKITKAGSFDTWAVFNITAAIVDASGYSKATLVHVDSAGTFTDADKVWVTFIANGVDGANPGYFYKFDSGTSDADPGAGEVAFNNGTYASVTEIYIDDADQHGATTQTDTITWDDSTAGHKGILEFIDINDRSTYARFKISGAATDASGYNKLTVTHLASNNTFSAGDSLSVHFAASGNDGAVPGYLYTFDTSTTDADPGAGEIRFNNGTYASATEIYIDDDDTNGATTSTDVLTWDDSTSSIKGYLHIVDTDDPTTYARFSVTGSSTDGSGYNKLAVTHLVSNNTFSAGDSLSVHFTRQGDKGDTGATGSTGSTGSTGASGTNSQLSMTFESTTSDADPGAGKIAFNNGTISSVSILYVDDADDASADITSYVQSWDDVSNSVARGIVTITKEGTASTFATFKVSGSVTDASGYTKVPVTHVVSSGSFSDNDGVGVHFSYSGADAGSTDLVNDATPQLGGDLDLNSNSIDFPTTANISDVKDEDDMASNSATMLATQQSIKAYVDASGGTSNADYNMIINGDMQIATRGTTITSTSTTTNNNDDSYTHDRWILLSDGNDIVDVKQSADSPNDGSSKSMQLEVETADKKFGIVQIIEQINCHEAIASGTVSLSFKMKASDASIDDVRAAVVAWSGTADTVTSDIVSAWEAEGTNPTLITNATYENTPADLNPTTSWAEYKIENVSVDTSSTGNILVFIWSGVTDVEVSDSLYITDVQLESGSTANSFKRLDIETTMQQCERYYESSMTWGTTGQYAGQQVSYGNASTTFGATVANLDGRQFRTRKRATPTVTLYHQDGTAGGAYRVHDAQKTTGIVAQHVMDYGFLFANKASAFNHGYAYYYSYIAEAEL